MIQAQLFHILLESSSQANRARLLSVAAPRASSWLSVVPSPGLGLHLESNEYQMAIRWWLGDEVFDLCRRAHLSVSVERGHGLTRDLAHTRPADILIAGWDRGKPAALDLTITSPLCSAILNESCHQAGVAALAAEARPCHPHTFGSNIMSCKTQSDWRKVCLIQCSLKGAPRLSDVMVSYACFSYSGNEVTFLQATCTCCSQVHTTSPPNTQATQETMGTLLDNGKVDAENQGIEDGYPLLLVGLATMAAAAVVLVCVAVLISYENTGALVNPSPVVERKGNWNYTKLEDHKHLPQEPNSVPSPAPRRGYQKLIESYSSPDQ
eukprot:Em0003g1853a